MSSRGSRALGELPEARALLAACPNAVALVARDGQVVHANDRFWAQLAPDAPPGCRLHDLVRDPAADVDGLLDRWAGSSSSRPGSLTFRDATVEAHQRIDGALAAGSELLLLHCQPRSVATRPFTAISADLERRNLRATQRRLEEALDELEHSNHLLQSINAELDDYASVVSHDLRSPLYTIAAFAEDLRTAHGESLSGDALESVAAIQRTARRALDLLGAVLRLARLEVAGPTEAGHDAEAACRDALEQLSSQILDAGAEIKVDGDLPPVRVEPAHLTMVLQNLVGNALRFRSPDRSPTVVIRAATNDEHVTIEVEDNGIGIPESRLERIFAPFERGQPAVGELGTGIGLTTCRKIVERYGGAIGVRSKVGVGTTVAFELPAG